MPFDGKPKTLLRLTSVVVAALALVTLSGCDARPADTSAAGQGPREVTVVGTGKVQGVPDTLIANVAISFIAQDATTALNQTNDRQQAVIDALVGAGVDSDDISTSQVSLQPQFSGDNTVTPAGYQASNAIDVRIRDVSTASRALGLIASTGGDATRINSVNFLIDDDSQLVKDARERAFNDAKERAQQYADLSGLKLGKVLSISEAAGSSTPPVPTPMPRAMATEVPLSPGQQTVSFSVTVIWQLG